MKSLVALLLLVAMVLTLATSLCYSQGVSHPMNSAGMAGAIGSERAGYCFMIGAAVGLALFSGQWWFALGGTLAAYNAGCI